jgi:SAM-dependent methyltransferase
VYEKTAQFYDAIYSFKDYQVEAARLRELIDERRPSTQTLLDVACGTGKHLREFADWYRCEGIDIEPDFVAIASQRLPGTPIHLQDFRSFDLGRKFDVVTCLFSAIGYAGDQEGLNRAIAAMAAHLHPDGLLIVEPWLFPENFSERHVAGLFVDQPDFKLARMNNSRVENGVSIFEMHHLVGTPDEVVHFVETHALTLYAKADYEAAFRAAGLQVEFDEVGLTGRGLFIGRHE